MSEDINEKNGGGIFEEESGKEAKAHDTSESSDKSMIEALTTTVSSLQEAVSGTYNKMVANLNQNMQTMKLLNSMMENFLVESVEISSKVQIPKNSNMFVEVEVSIRNGNNHLPLLSCNLFTDFNCVDEDKKNETIRIESINIVEKPEIEEQTNEVLKSMIQIDNSNGSEAKKNIEDSTNKIFEDFIIPPGMQTRIILKLKPSSFARFNATLNFSFLSPGTNQRLIAFNRFGIYYIHQCLIMLGNNELDGPSTQTFSVPAMNLRYVLSLSPSEGLSKGQSFTLKLPLGKLAVTFFLSDIKNEGCEVILETNSNIPFSTFLIEELKKIST